MTDKPDGGAPQMTGPDKIWAVTDLRRGDTTGWWWNFNPETDDATEYTRTAAHPVTVEVLVKLLERADQVIMEILPDYLFEGREPETLVGEIRAAIAQIKAMK